jgi:membrane fusion protein (multidrug efflux system)
VLELVLDDGRVYEHQGKEALVDREVDVKTGTMTVRGFFPNPGNILRPGQYAKVRASIDVAKDALLVPQKAVVELQGGFRVGVVGADGSVDVRGVETGERSGDLVVVRKGLKPGERVMLSGLQYMRAGLVVKPVEAAAATPAPATAAR